ncbi:ABC transporter substrate-binding protein [Zunongwangia endophytica]|uniref:ABC transporter substrate-binding protein n=1 Tax=Zunongwangia endophytica TaxID=1808945 RepID=A0ABV8HF16_9FLAO|nr:helical backbone metal receptor [Zunongwangia endophytica]MDN3593329.1 helical backbone metal receptor [Zunongwangia endophytica]
MVIFDHLGRKLSFPNTPKRIVSLVPSQTELLVDLGLIDSLVGITKFCIHPENLRKQKLVVGGTKSVHFDKIAELNPDIILCNKEENTKEMVAELEKIAPVHVSEVSGVAQSLQLITEYGKLFNAEKEAEFFVSKIESKLQILSEKIQNKKWESCVYLIWKDPYMAAGSDTFINELLQLNKLENKIVSTRYPEVSLEQLKEYAPDMVLLSSEPFPFNDDHVVQLRILGLNAIKVDGEYFSWYGSRLEKAIDYFIYSVAQFSTSG